jgi:flagellar protein FliS
MMYSQNKAAQYRSVRNYGVVAEATPARLVQIMYEHILAQLAAARGSMSRIQNQLPLHEVVTKCAAISKAVRIIGHLDSTLDMNKGGAVAENLRQLYLYSSNRLTQANAVNDPAIVDEVYRLVAKVKTGWDQLVKDGM